MQILQKHGLPFKALALTRMPHSRSGLPTQDCAPTSWKAGSNSKVGGESKWTNTAPRHTTIIVKHLSDLNTSFWGCALRLLPMPVKRYSQKDSVPTHRQSRSARFYC